VPNDVEPLAEWEVYGKRIKELCDKIEEHFKNTLQKHQSDFIQAYKGQMVKVQKELEFMNHKKKETADKTMNDDQITSL